MIFAIDNGYNAVKCKYGDKIFSIPSAIAIFKTQMVTRNDFYSFEGKKYLVGESAVRNAISTRDYSFRYKFDPLLLFHSLKHIGIDPKSTDLEIHIGLSLYDLEKKAEFDTSCVDRREEFKKRMSSFVVDGEKYNFNIKLFAQGQGIWKDYSNKNSFLKNGYEVIVDIGYRTKDILVFKDGKPDKTECFADDKGINVINTELKTILDKKYDFSLSEQSYVSILKDKSITIYGEKKDISLLIDEIVDSYIDSLIAYLKSEIGDILKSSERVIISGGGAYILQEYKYRFPKNVVFDERGEFEFANVRGYYNG